MGSDEEAGLSEEIEQSDKAGEDKADDDMEKNESDEEEADKPEDMEPSDKTGTDKVDADMEKDESDEEKQQTKEIEQSYKADKNLESVKDAEDDISEEIELFYK